MVLVLAFLAFVYLILGFVYAVTVHKNGAEPWYVFPINVIGGPIVFIRLYKVTKEGRRPPYGRT